MANDVASSAPLTEAIATRFNSEVLRPLLAHATDHPGDVVALIAVLREKLDALETVLAGYAAPRLNGADALRDAAGINGSGARPDEREEIGRNQRSRVREMILLDELAGAARAFALPQLMKALAAEGFDDGQAAVVSQLHRMKKLGLIDQPGSGMYEVTQDGLGHLRKLRASFGPLRADRRR